MPITIPIIAADGAKSTVTAPDPLVGGVQSVNIGETAILVEGDNGNGNLIVAQPVTVTQAGVLQTLSFYVTTVGGKLRLGLYSGATLPTTKLAEVAEFTPVAGWNTKPTLTTPALLPGQYWLVYFPQSNALGFRKAQTGGTSYYKALTYGVLPAAFPASPNSTLSHWSFYMSVILSIRDTTPPTVPTNLAGTSPSSSQVNLTWTASTDAVSLAGYYVYRNGVKVGTVSSPSGTSYSDTGLVASTQYTYAVSAFDWAGNTSTQSASTNVTTLAGGGGRPPYNTGVGFFIGTDNKLYDANGNPFRIRGVNRNHYDNGDGTGIANAHANTARAVLYWGNGTTAAQFVSLFTTQYLNRHVVIMPGVWTTTTNHTVTCSDNTADLTSAVDDWVAQASAWKTIERYSLINIANEWGPENSVVWRDAYITAISRMRTAGYLGTLVIDSGQCGQDLSSITDYGQAVFDSDPQKNIIFSIHIYNNTQAGHAASNLAPLVATGLPFIIGEFGPGRNIGPAPTNLTPGELIQAAEAVGVGWIAWAWDDNNLGGGLADDNWFSMTYNPGIGYATSNPSDLTIFGLDVVTNAIYGLQALSTPATIFS